MSFKNYLKETEELEVNQELEEKKEAIKELFTGEEKVTNEKIQELADELEMEFDDLQVMIYEYLTELLTVDEEEVTEEETEDIDIDNDFVEI